MAQKNQSERSSLELTQITRSIFFLCAIYTATIVLFDSGNLLTKSAVIQRWALITAVLIINALAWLVSSQVRFAATTKHIVLSVILSASLLILAGMSTYWERGMASTSTILYILPLLVIATLKNRHALIVTCILCISAYSFASVKYFNDFFNEGYRIQLWGHIVLYAGVLFTATWLIMALSGLRHDSK